MLGPPVSRICVPGFQHVATSPHPTRTDWRQLYPFASHWADVPGGRMHYLDEGPASIERQCGTDAALRPRQSHLVVSLAATDRGAASRTTAAWRRTTSAAGSAISRRGCCRLDEHIDNLCALVEQLDLERVTLVAQDWGGAIGLGRDAAHAGTTWKASCCSTRARFRRGTFPGESAPAAFPCWVASPCKARTCSASPRCE